MNPAFTIEGTIATAYAPLTVSAIPDTSLCAVISSSIDIEFVMILSADVAANETPAKTRTITADKNTFFMILPP